MLSVTTFVAQLDKTNGSNDKGKIKATVLKNAKSSKKPVSIELKDKDGFKKAYKKERDKLQKKQQEEYLENREVLSNEQLKKIRFQERYGQRIVPKVDTHQGNFLTTTKEVTLSFRDFGAIDGDEIAIFHNGIKIIAKTILTRNYQAYLIPLQKGYNKLEILALNQGNLGANTAQYILVSKEGFTIATQHWFLATGAKTSFSVYKQ